ncbi:MAG TPA: redoxin domain-containing protein [Candidatus Avacidaminococcus intestinavium]|uniref:Redoxin domain-containing protein n=1 Tax=Candidatus Avacidaminococcus intestinavium TaxID=2840684 RepID=A0A9D1MPC2_9FIRM|nr:redoxin domain-containing protein [Candidatus Avacidaminococcus intestinavium]
MEDIIKSGEQAPEFTLYDQNGMAVSLQELRGKKVLLSWHPLAWTGVCTDQMRLLERNYQRLAEKNIVALGISVDPQPSKAAWAKVLCLSELKILADFYPLGQVTKAYGVFSSEYGASKRANVLVDESGKVIWSKKYEIKTLPDVEEILAQA